MHGLAAGLPCLWGCLCAWLLASAGGASAHSMPNSMLLLDFGERSVALEATLPWRELKYGLPAELAEPPPQMTAPVRAELARYLGEHFGAASPDGRPWRVAVDEIALSPNPDHVDLRARLTLTPPAGAPASRFVLHDSAVIHIVMSHVALVFAAQDGGEPRLVGVLQNPAFDLAVSRPSGVRGFGSAFWLGMRHIAEGPDHLLFLLTLLLPAPLVAVGGRWGPPKPARAALISLASTVTAFTLGHSITLVAGAAFDLQIPQQPVEAAIAASILVAAVAAWRPFLGGAGPPIAGGFGLVHGLAFAAVLGEFRLTPLAKAEAIAGFNLGIEAVQLLVVLAVAPLLIGLARTPAYRWVRPLGAAGAGLAAVAWVAARLMGTPG
jgi:hypothetical protein